MYLSVLEHAHARADMTTTLRTGRHAFSGIYGELHLQGVVAVPLVVATVLRGLVAMLSRPRR